MEGSFTVPQHVLERLSPTMQQDLLSRQSTKFELKHSYFSPMVISVLRQYFECGGDPVKSEALITAITDDDAFMQVARACDELGLRGLLQICTSVISRLLSDPRKAVEEVREYFQIPFKDQIVEPSSKSDLAKAEEDEVASRLSRSTLYEASPEKTVLRDFSHDVLLSKKQSAMSYGGTNCFLCQREFTTLDRRHTCRNCNNPVCGSCTLYIELPKGSQPAMQQSLMTLARTWDYSKHLVCKQCIFCIAFGVLDLDIIYITRAAAVSKKWRHAALNFGREMLDIQYKLPFQELSARERRRLWVNRKYWIGHSKWLLQLLKSIEWNDPEISREAAMYISDLPKSSRLTSCTDIWCSSRCEIHIDAGDALELLSASVSNQQVRELAVQCLRRTSDEKLLCFLPMLVNDLRYESTPSSCALWSFLLEKAFAGGSESVHSELCNQLYWALSVLSDGDRRFLSLQQRLIIEIAKKFGDSHALQLIRGLDFVAMLDAIPAGSKTDGVKAHLAGLFPHLGLSAENSFRLPISPEVSVTAFDLEHLKVETSSTAPLILPCRKTDGSTHRIMFKQEDLRKDWIVVNVIRFMSIILREAGMPLNILTYRVLPTSKNSGFIEIVPDSVTIFDIEVKLKTSLHKYIFDKNRRGVVGEIFDRFSSSMAGYSLVCYILALGDRHKNNIMIRDDGTLFHIDFGYILGKDAKLKATIAPYMRITPEMKEAMGGEGSAEYELFQKRCFDGMTILRRWTSVFCNMLLLLTNANPPIVGETLEQLQNIIYDRFRPDSLPSEATQALSSAMERSNDATGGKVVDTFHHIARISGATLGPLSEGFTQTSSSVSNSVRRWWPWGGSAAPATSQTTATPPAKNVAKERQKR